MFSYIWPVALVVVSNIIYHVAAKCLPGDMDPMASLTITYTVGAVTSWVLFLAVNRNGHLLQEYAKTNWAPFALGVVIVGLEIGILYAYRAGWPVSTAQIVQSSFLAVALIFIGYFLFKEALTWNKLVGIVICLVGLFLINK